MKVLVCFLALSAMLPGTTMAKGAIVVQSRVGAGLQGDVAGAIALLQAGGVRVVEVFASEGGCEKRARAIVICEDAVAESRADFRWQHGTLAWGVIRLPQGAAWGDARIAVCHELSHVLTNSTSHGSWDDAVPCPFDWRAYHRHHR